MFDRIAFSCLNAPMSKKMLIFGVPIFLFAVVGGALSYRSGVLRQMEKTVQNASKDGASEGKNGESEGESGYRTMQFVTDVDPDVSHWQTKETKTFTIKFPKEWHWIEFPGYDDQGRGGSHVISNFCCFY